MSSKYWREREEEWKNKQKKSEEEYIKQIQEIYLNTLDSVTKEIESFFSRYATKEGISMAEAKKKGKKIDIEEYKRKAEKYVKEKDFSDQANEEMRLYNLTMKVNRLELLKANIGAELVNGTNELQTYYGDKLDEETMKELERNASILGPSVLDNAKNARIAIDSSFQNATWSERVWNNQTLLKNSLSNIISNALIQGKNARDFIPQIRKQFDVSRYQAERLLRTEIARAQVQAQAESYIAEDIEDYEYVACSLTDCCKVCKALNGKVFKVKDMEPGENAPPMHPNCHCATAPYLDRKEFDEWLNGYKDHGLTFEEWNQQNSKTNEVSRNLAIRNGNIYGIITKGNTNIPEDLQREIDNSLHRVFKEFPTMKSFINKIEFSNNLKENEIAQAVINYKLETILKLNANIFSNKKVYTNLIMETDESFVKKSSLDDYLKHEMIHFLEWNYAIKKDKNTAYEKISQDYYSTNLLKRACEEWT